MSLSPVSTLPTVLATPARDYSDGDGNQLNASIYAAQDRERAMLDLPGVDAALRAALAERDERIACLLRTLRAHERELLALGRERATLRTALAEANELIGSLQCQLAVVQPWAECGR